MVQKTVRYFANELFLFAEAMKASDSERKLDNRIAGKARVRETIVPDFIILEID